MNIILDKYSNEHFNGLETLSEFINQYNGDKLVVEFKTDIYYGELNLCNLKLKELIIRGNNSFINGKTIIKCNFRRYNENLIKANIGKDRDFERLMIDDSNLIMSRYPKFNKDAVLNGCGNYKDIEARAKNWKEGTKGYLRSLHINEWGGNSYEIQKVNDNLVMKWVGDNNRGKDFDKNKVVAEGIFEELSEDGEWYYDKLSGELFLFCRNNFKETIEVGIIDKISLLNINNCSKTAITIDGINFCDSERSTFKGKWERYLRSDWAFNDKSAVKITDSGYINFTNCNFKNLGATALLIEKNCNEITVNNCNFVDCLSNGVLILGDKDCTYCSSSWENDRHITEFENPEFIGANTDSYPKNISISDSYFYNLGIEDKQSAAVCISLANRVTVKNCTVHHMPRAGINICENAFGGHSIIENDIFDCVRETGDHGPFNSWGRDRFWSIKKFTTMGKYGKLKNKYFAADMLDKNIIRGNRIVGEHGFGIDLDDGSSWYDIENNFCYGVGIKLREGFNRKVNNNIIINAPLDLHATFANNDDIIENNIVYHSSPLNIVILNRGYTTKLANNYFIGCDEKSTKNNFNGNKTNSILNIKLTDVIEQNFDFKNFNKIPFNFGKIGSPQPCIGTEGKSGNITIYRFKGNIFKSIDESLRSMCGLPNYNGAFVAKIGFFSPLKRLGVKTGDVIAEINGEQILNDNFSVLKADTIKTIKVFRNQILKTLK